MTETNKPLVNGYCQKPEDRVVETKCALCRRCYVFVQSQKGRNNGMCVYGGPFSGFVKGSNT